MPLGRMDVRFTIGLAIAPALLLLWLFKKWDEKRPEPPGAIRNVVIFGMITCIPAALIELAMHAVLGKDVVEAQGQFLNAFLVAAFTEEAVKLAVVLVYLWRKPHFDEVMDGILYTAAASLGFALLENVLYSAGNVMTGLLRAFTAVPLHAVCSGIMGYFVGRAKMSKGGVVGWIAAGFAAAVFIHGFYDWIAFSGAGFGFMPPDPVITLVAIVVFVGICGVILRALVKHALALDDQLLGAHPRPLPSGPQPSPGAPAPGAWAPAPYAPAPYAPAPYAPAPYAPAPYGAAPAPYPQQAPYPPQAHPQQAPPPQQAYPQHAYPQHAPHPQQAPYAPGGPSPQAYTQQPMPNTQAHPQQPYAGPPAHPGPRGPWGPHGSGHGGQGT